MPRTGGIPYENPDARQRSRCPRSVRGRMQLCLQLSRHAQHRDHRVRSKIPRDLRRMGTQREGRHGSGLRREPVRPPQLLRHEACRPERRSRSPVHAVLHRRARRHGHRRGGRRGHALVSERAGFPSLCHRRKAADARAVRRRGVAGVRQAGLRALREVRYAGPAQDVHARRARAECSGDVRTAGGRPDPL